ncbi:hypothetical protein [Pseudomonas mohnii]|nr:hypothetical protein [Pseudomonas mohnii]
MYRLLQRGERLNTDACLGTTAPELLLLASDLNYENVIMWITCFKNIGVRSVLLFWGMFLVAGVAPAMSFTIWAFG